MKNIRRFLPRHTLVLLLLAVVLTMPTAALWAKYALDVEVTKSLTLTVETVPQKEYAIDRDKYCAAFKALSDKPDVLKFVKGSEVPKGLTAVALIQTDTSEGKIGMYQDGDTVYVAPADASDSSNVLYAPTDCSDLFNPFADWGDWSGQSTIDLSNFDTSRVTDMSKMFYWQKDLSTLDLSGFDTSQVVDMNEMFQSCSGLTSPNFGSSYDTSAVTNMEDMFNYCSKLTLLDLSSFNTSAICSTIVCS